MSPNFGHYETRSNKMAEKFKYADKYAIEALERVKQRIEKEHIEDKHLVEIINDEIKKIKGTE